MADSNSEHKTEQPTPHRREEARERGQVARSRDLSLGLCLVSGFGAAHLCGPWFGGETAAMAQAYILGVTDAPGAVSPDTVGRIVLTGGTYLLWMIMPVAAAVCSVAIASAILQGGGRIHPHLVSPDASRLSPIQGIRRLYSMRSLFRGGFAVVKIIVVAWLLVSSVRAFVAGKDLSLSTGLLDSGATLLTFSWKTMMALGVRLGLALTLLAVLDYGVQRWLHTRSLRMSPEEIREEAYRLEGDPSLKAERRRQWSRLVRLARIGSDAGALRPGLKGMEE